MAYNIAPDTIVQRHPIRGALWGTMMGCGIALHLVNFAVVPFGTWSLLAAPIVGGLVLGTLWGRFGRVKPLKGRIPAALRGAHTQTSRDNSPQARRAAQLAAARQAQAELQMYAQKNTDEAMCAALEEAQRDIHEAMSRRTTKATATPAEAAPAAATEPSAADGEVASPTPVDTVAGLGPVVLDPELRMSEAQAEMEMERLRLEIAAAAEDAGLDGAGPDDAELDDAELKDTTAVTTAPATSRPRQDKLADQPASMFPDIEADLTAAAAELADHFTTTSQLPS